MNEKSSANVREMGASLVEEEIAELTLEMLACVAGGDDDQGAGVLSVPKRL